MLKYTSIFALLLVFTSCEKDDPEIPNEEELITTVIVNLQNNTTGETSSFKWIDLDGDGGDAPTIDSMDLRSDQTYTMKLELLNELENPAESINVEIIEEAADHQFFFSTTLLSVLIAYADQDMDTNPIGLTNTLTTLSSPVVSTGDLTITLRHEPNKGAEGVSDGNIENAGGETDIEVNFPINVR